MLFTRPAFVAMFMVLQPGACSVAGLPMHALLAAQTNLSGVAGSERP